MVSAVWRDLAHPRPSLFWTTLNLLVSYFIGKFFHYFFPTFFHFLIELKKSSALSSEGVDGHNRFGGARGRGRLGSGGGGGLRARLSPNHRLPRNHAPQGPRILRASHVFDDARHRFLENKEASIDVCKRSSNYWWDISYQHNVNLIGAQSSRGVIRVDAG